MKKMICLLGMVISLACNPVENDSSSEAEVTFEIYSPIQLDTKADTTPGEEWEQKTRCADFLVFSSADGIIAKHLRTDGSTPVTAALKAGKYLVWAVVNAPDMFALVKTEEDLKKAGLRLRGDAGEFNSFENGMIQANSDGKGVEVEILPGESIKLVIQVKRFVSRVVLKEIKNSLPPSCGEMTVENAFLSNVSLYRTIAKVKNDLNLWGNVMGRSDGSEENVIDGKTHLAEYPDLTFVALDTHLARGKSYKGPHGFYAYQNYPSDDNRGWDSVWSPRRTRLVVTASFDGMKYYYPVSIPSLIRNNTYDVSLTILGPGSIDPDIPVEKGSVEIKLDVSDCSFLHYGSTSDKEEL